MKPQERGTPPGANPAEQREAKRGLGFYGVAALAILALCGDDYKAHLLPRRAVCRSAFERT